MLFAKESGGLERSTCWALLRCKGVFEMDANTHSYYQPVLFYAWKDKALSDLEGSRLELASAWFLPACQDRKMLPPSFNFHVAGK